MTDYREATRGQSDIIGVEQINGKATLLFGRARTTVSYFCEQVPGELKVVQGVRHQEQTGGLPECAELYRVWRML